MVEMSLLPLIFLHEMVGSEVEPKQQLLPEQVEEEEKQHDRHPVVFPSVRPR